MKLLCIEDRKWNTYLLTYDSSKCPTITKGKMYDVAGRIRLLGHTHYLIKCDKGYINQYFHTRFTKVIFKQLKIL